MVTLYTTAPQAYDYDYVERDERVSAYMILLRGEQAVHCVRIPEQHVGYQTARYASGMYATLDIQELIEQEAMGLVRFED